MKIVYVVVGCITLALGTIGVVFPILPTVPFYLITAFCYARSSERLNQWFKNTKLYKNNLETYVKGQGMSRKAKIRIMATVTIIILISFYFMKKIWIGRIILIVIWVAHILYFVFKVKTIEEV